MKCYSVRIRAERWLEIFGDKLQYMFVQNRTNNSGYSSAEHACVQADNQPQN